MTEKGPDADIDAIDREFAELAHLATEAAYARALREVGSVVVARDGRLVRLSVDGAATVLATITPRVRKARKTYKFAWTPPSRG